MANKPNNPSLWSKAKSLAKQKFDVYPSAYANGWAAKWYKSKGGTWRKAQEGMTVPYSKEYVDSLRNKWINFYNNPASLVESPSMDDRFDDFYYSESSKVPKVKKTFPAWVKYYDDGDYELKEGSKDEPPTKFGKPIPGYKFVENFTMTEEPNTSELARLVKAIGTVEQRKPRHLRSVNFPRELMQVGGLFPRFMQDGGEPDGGMALGQMAAVIDKLSKLREFIGEDTDLEPWVSSKLAVMDHYADAVSDYMMYGAEGDQEEEGEEEEEDEDLSEDEMEEMKNGGIPERYRKRGFTRVGAKRKSNRPGKKWMVLAKKGDKYKIVHGGYKGMQDYTQHRNKKRQKNFWNRMGGRNSGKATDPFSPLYWHKRFGTWQDGGNINNNLNTNFMNPLYDFIQRAQIGGQQQSQDEQLMQIIAMFAQMQGIDPQDLMQQLQQLSAEEQQQAIMQMAQAVQQQGADGQQQMMRSGGKYGAGGEMGGPVELPALPVDIYGIPTYGGGGAAYLNPYTDAMMEMQDGGKPEWLIRAQLKAQGYSGSALENKMSQMKQGGIHINPKNKGKFTAKAKAAGMGVQAYASKVLGAPEGQYPASTRRQANFARNAADWKKQDGGLAIGTVIEDADDELINRLRNEGYTIEIVG